MRHRTAFLVVLIGLMGALAALVGWIGVPSDLKMSVFVHWLLRREWGLLMARGSNRVARGLAAMLAAALAGSGVLLGTRAGWRPVILDSTEQGFGLMELSGKGTVRQVFRLGAVGIAHWRKKTSAEFRADPPP